MQNVDGKRVKVIGNGTVEIREFVDATFTKLRTTQRKLQDMKNMYLNIFTNVLSYVNGSICVIVDKDYKDNGLFEDGIWLKEPICFSKLFTLSKSYSEEKLRAYAELFMNMLNFDGITIIDGVGNTHKVLKTDGLYKSIEGLEFERG